MWKLQPWSVEKHLLEKSPKVWKLQPWSVEKHLLEEPKRVETSALGCELKDLGRAQTCGNFSLGVWKNTSWKRAQKCGNFSLGVWKNTSWKRAQKCGNFSPGVWKNTSWKSPNVWKLQPWSVEKTSLKLTLWQPQQAGIWAPTCCLINVFREPPNKYIYI